MPVEMNAGRLRWFEKTEEEREEERGRRRKSPPRNATTHFDTIGSKEVHMHKALRELRRIDYEPWHEYARVLNHLAVAADGVGYSDDLFGEEPAQRTLEVMEIRGFITLRYACERQCWRFTITHQGRRALQVGLREAYLERIGFRLDRLPPLPPAPSYIQGSNTPLYHHG